jgi:hypothetical protein
MPKGRSSRKTGKVMNFSQAVIGKSAKRTRKGTPGIIAVKSTGKVNMSPSKARAPKLGGKRVY